MNPRRSTAQTTSAFSRVGIACLSSASWLVSLGLLLAPATAWAITGQVVNVVPTDQSGEAWQNSEPSLGVIDANNLFISAFEFDGVHGNPIYRSVNGGAAWMNSDDVESRDITVEGNRYYVRLSDPTVKLGYMVDRNLNGIPDTTPQYTDYFIEVGTFNAALTGRNAPLTTHNPADTITFEDIGGPPGVGGPNGYGPLDGVLDWLPNNDGLVELTVPVPDQPWIEVSGNNILVTHNEVGASDNTASVLFSTNAGTTWKNVVIEHGTPFGQDSPAVRVAASGNKAYAAFQRYTGAAGNDLSAEIVVVRDDNLAAGDDFEDLKDGGSNVGVKVREDITVPNISGGTTLGQERLGSDLSIAVSRKDDDVVYVGHVEVVDNRPRLRVDFSRDGGKSWHRMLTRESSALPALATTNNGAVGLLYTTLNPANNNLETHFLQTSSTDDVLATFPDGAPARVFHPYIGDYQDLEAGGDTFYGTFSAANDPNPAHFPQGVLYQRNVNVGGTVMNNFQLTAAGTLDDGTGGGGAPGAVVAASIDPFFFSDTAAARSKRTAVSFSVDGGLNIEAREGHPVYPKNPAEGLENGVHAAQGPNDVYVLGPATPNGGSTGGWGLPTEGEVFVSGLGPNAAPDGTNVDRLSGALGTLPRVGPHAPPPGPSPATGAGVFGLVPNDNIISLSYGMDSGSVLYFSVDPKAKGKVGTDVNLEAVASVKLGVAGGPTPENPGGGDPGDEAAGDVFASQRLPSFGDYVDLHYVLGKTAPLVARGATNALLYDEEELGLQAPAANGSNLGFAEDDLDALELTDPRDPIWGTDFNGNGTLDFGERPTFFSLDPFSPSIGAKTVHDMGGIPKFTEATDDTVSTDDILMVVPGGEDEDGDGVLDVGEDIDGDTVLDPFVYGVYASGILDIGLKEGDVIDALALSDVGRIGFLDKDIDVALFSLLPGSPTLTMGGLSAADVFITDFDKTFSLFALHSELGLLFEDNLNALDILLVPEPSAILLAAIAAVASLHFVRRRRHGMRC